MWDTVQSVLHIPVYTYAVDHGGDIVLSGCFAASATGISTQRGWSNVFNLTSSEENWMFQQDRYSKYSSKLVLESLKQLNIISV